MRVITTGWRYWATSDRAVEDMWRFLDGLLDIVLMTTDPVLQLLIGGGDEHDRYPGGADRCVTEWAKANRDYHGEDKVPSPIVFHAEWDKYHQAAGPIRNAQMITAGADLCLGFLHPDSKGTRDCLGKAQRAKIPTMTVAWRPDQDPVEVKRGTAREIPLPA